MATANLSNLSNLISIEEYLNTSYRPDVDYVDGKIEERNLGEFDHADLQSEINAVLRAHQKDWGVRVVVETRVRVSPIRVRIPDVCVLSAGLPRERIISHPPLLCVEVAPRHLQSHAQACPGLLRHGRPSRLDLQSRNPHRPRMHSRRHDGIQIWNPPCRRHKDQPLHRRSLLHPRHLRRPLSLPAIHFPGKPTSRLISSICSTCRNVCCPIATSH